MWNWLSNSENQKTLAFVGAGIVGFIALLIQLGWIGRKNKAPSPATSAPSNPAVVSTPAPATQGATAEDGGVIAQIQGSDNQVQIGR